MAKISKDLIAGNLHPREDLFVTAALASLNAETIIYNDGGSTMSLDIRGTFVGTLEVNGTIDGINWTLIPIRPIAGGIYAISATAAGMWTAAVASFTKIRVRMTAFTSGSATVFTATSTAVLDQSLQGAVTPLLVTAVGAAGAAVTLTLPAPGAGLRHYLTYLSMNRFATALLTAGATPVNTTSTNLPGSLAFSFAADAAAQGSLDRWREDFSFPIAAVAQNTATTIVLPVTTGVIWRATAGYYVAP